MDDGSTREYIVEGAPSPLFVRHSKTVHPPLPPGQWLMANGPSMFGDHRLFVQAMDGRFSGSQRFASDWMLLGPDGRLAKGDPALNASWYGYGTPVLAVGDGVVAGIADSIPENIPLSEKRSSPMRRETAGGNFVVLRLAKDVFAFYGHLQPGSLKVAVGDRVRSGQILGRIGNSGNSDAPHLHFHMIDSDDPMSGQGIPFALDSYTVLDRMDAADWDPMLTQNVPWLPSEKEKKVCRNRMPVGEAIIEFKTGGR
jgi:hypothetical protein